MHFLAAMKNKTPFSGIWQARALVAMTVLGTLVTLESPFVSAQTTARNPSARVILSDLERPWAVVTSPTNEIWITEKEGRIKIFNSGYKLQSTLTGFPDLAVYGEGGVLDLAFHPDFVRNRQIYVAYSVVDPNQPGNHLTQINRFEVQNGSLTNRKIILNGPSSNAGTHFGCRLAFDSSGFLYASFGERRLWTLSQDPNVLHGKIVRLTDDGRIPRDNPTPGSPIYSLGHRNPQGLEFDPRNGRLFSSEHGPSGYDAEGGGDEINEVVRGGNYGWPVYHHRNNAPGFIAPIAEYTPAVAPSGIAFYTGSRIPKWKNSLFVATLRGQTLLRLEIDTNGQVTSEERLIERRHGRLRDVATSPNGTLLVISESGRLIEFR